MDALLAVFFMLTEAVKASGFARFVAKAKSLKQKVVKPFGKGADPDPKFDTRGKVFQHPEYLMATNRSIEVKRFVATPMEKQKGFLDYNNIYIDKVWTLAFFEKQFVSNSDVIRDVRKKKVKPPPKPNHKTMFKAQLELLELWIVLLNIQDFIKDFLEAEFSKEVSRYHEDALMLLANVRDASKPVDLRQLEQFLTRDLRLVRIAVLGTASEFQFYSAAADEPVRIFFSMDIRDLGVDLLQAYETSSAKVADGKLKGRRLLEQTFRSTDDITQRRRLTYELVVQTFGRYYALLKHSAKVKRTDGRAEARKAFGPGLELTPELPDFEKAVQIMLGGDEVFVAADPRFEAYEHKIVADLDTTTYKGRLNMRTSVSYSKVPASAEREKVQLSHHQAMTEADAALSVLKDLERMHRRIERLIEKLEQNEKKKDDAPKFAERLKKLRLMKLFIRVHWGNPRVLPPKEFARLIGTLRTLGINAVDDKDRQLVDYEGTIVNRKELQKEATALEDAVSARVGRDNVRIEPPPLYGRKPPKPKPDDGKKRP